MSLRLSGTRIVSFACRLLQTRRSLTLSAVEGPKHPLLEHRTLSVYFRDEILAKHAERPALICRQEKPRAHGGPPSPNTGVRTHLAWDFGEFDRHIHALARGLVSLGVQKGDRVAVVMGNNRCAPHWRFCSSSSSSHATPPPLPRTWQPVCVVTMGMCERGCDPGDAQPCLSRQRTREHPCLTLPTSARRIERRHARCDGDLR